MSYLPSLTRLQKTAAYQVETLLALAARSERLGDAREARNHELAAVAWQALRRPSNGGWGARSAQRG